MLTGFVTATFFPNPEVRAQAGYQPAETTQQVGTKLGLSREQVEILKKCLHDSPISEMLVVAGRTNRSKFRDGVLNPLIDTGLIEMTIPDKPRSWKQRYRITRAGLALLENAEAERNF